MAYPAMLKFLPAGFMGLMIAGLLPHTYRRYLLSQLGHVVPVHDFYRRFIRETQARSITFSSGPL